jgi:hypothetical protein
MCKEFSYNVPGSMCANFLHKKIKKGGRVSHRDVCRVSHCVYISYTIIVKSRRYINVLKRNWLCEGMEGNTNIMFPS